MTRRDAFVEWALAQVGKPALWGAKGPDAFDCSGLVTAGLHQIGACDWRQTHNANRLAHELPSVSTPRAGDLAVYGPSSDFITHVVICLDGGHVLSASGAQPKIQSIAAAKKAGAMVRRKNSHVYRPDWRGFRSLGRLLDVPLDCKEKLDGLHA